MFRKSSIAYAILLAISSASASASAKTIQLSTIDVIANKAQNDQQTLLSTPSIQARNATDIKSLLSQQVEIEVTNLQKTRSGNESINIRGLQGNRVSSSVDGIQLPESQENKLFTTVGMAFGRGDFIEPSALRSVSILHNKASQALSNAVNFSTLEPKDLLDEKAIAGFLSGNYNSLDRSTTGTVGFALQNEKYQRLLLTTYRQGKETTNQGKIGGIGSTRTQPNPANYKNNYILVKNYYQVNDAHRLGLIFEHLQKKKNTEQLSLLGVSTNNHGGISTTTNNLTDNLNDQNQRSRLSLTHSYTQDNLDINTHLYYQNSKTNNFRTRYYTTNQRAVTRIDRAENRDQIYGLQTTVSHYIDTNTPQLLRYGLDVSYQNLTNQLITTSAPNRKPSADTKQIKSYVFLEDQVNINTLEITPHLGLTYWKLNPNSNNGYIQRAEDYAPILEQHKFAVIPKLSVYWNVSDIAKPYFQYSKGVKPASAQQLTTSFGNSRGPFSYSIVGNPYLKPESANNFEFGLTGDIQQVSYRLAGYYNLYKNFIDYKQQVQTRNLLVIQYENIAKAKIYGVEANLTWRIMDNLKLNTAFAYAKGKRTEQDGSVHPINTIQPLKLKIGLAYETERWGTSVLLSHSHAKSSNDIDGTMFNPSRSYNLVDLGIYWKPLKSLTLNANLNNVFNKTYWNWADISYLAGRSNETSSYDGSVSINKDNASAYSAAGRTFNVGIRYEF
ncbi:TonB-dependent receptor [Avibacterium sp. 21-586]|uniref:TonB-dependent receptor domain-containing protein n=1 Tax=Avibacterium sp. 21-586 TaxID=2911534 RepID=UPI0022484DB0|nr:TonB-dependent receptor [Avibacterium sp. 21-586]MCW9710281.1 TonB-dependent receptor [Avibacterium sp. 21-586]